MPCLRRCFAAADDARRAMPAGRRSPMMPMLLMSDARHSSAMLMSPC